jgi:hypothetical protein
MNTAIIGAIALFSIVVIGVIIYFMMAKDEEEVDTNTDFTPPAATTTLPAVPALPSQRHDADQPPPPWPTPEIETETETETETPVPSDTTPPPQEETYGQEVEPVSGYYQYQGFVYDGAEIKTHQGSKNLLGAQLRLERNGCASLCDADTACAGFTWSTSSNGSCTLRKKSTLIDPLPVATDGNYATYLRKPVDTWKVPEKAGTVGKDKFSSSGASLGYYVYPSSTYGGPGIKDKVWDGQQKPNCIAACDMIPSCVGFTWYHKDRKCRLHSDNTAATETIVPTVDANYSIYLKEPF